MRFKFSKLRLGKKNTKNPPKKQPSVVISDEDAEFGFVKPSNSLNDALSSSSSVKTDIKTLSNGNIKESIHPSRNNKNVKQKENDKNATKRNHNNNTFVPIDPVLSKPSSDPTTVRGLKPEGFEYTARKPQPMSARPNRNHHPVKTTHPPRNYRNFQEYSSNHITYRNYPTTNLERHNSMLKLGNWVQGQKIKHQSNKPPSSMLNLTKANGQGPWPSTGRQWRPKSQNDLLEQNGEAFNAAGPPIDHQNASLSRPMSHQEINLEPNQQHQMVNWKSYNYLTPNYDKESLRMKSQKIVPWNHQGMDQNKMSYSSLFLKNSRDQALANSRLRSPKMTSAPVRHLSFYKAVDHADKDEPPKTSLNERENVLNSIKNEKNPKEVKTVPEKIVENLLIVVEQLVNDMESFIGEIKQLETTKWRIDLALRKSTFQQLSDIRTKELHTKLRDVRFQIAQTAQKMRDVISLSEAKEKELMQLKTSRLEDLSKKVESASKQFQLEWDLGRIQIALEKLETARVGAKNKTASLKASRYSSSASSTSGRSRNIHSFPAQTQPSMNVQRSKSTLENRLSKSHGDLKGRDSAEPKTKCKENHDERRRNSERNSHFTSSLQRPTINAQVEATSQQNAMKNSSFI